MVSCVMKKIGLSHFFVIGFVCPTIMQLCFYFSLVRLLKKFFLNFFIFVLLQPVAYPEASRCQYTGLGAHTMCPNWRKTDVKQHQLFNHIFNADVPTSSQIFDLSKTLKINELKTLYMSMSATLFCLNVSQNIVCINKSGLYIAPVCPNLPLDTALTIFLL